MSADVQSPPAEAPPPPSALKKHLPFLLALVGGLAAGGASGAFLVGPALARGIAPAAVAERGAAEEKGAKAAKGEKADTSAAKQVYTLDNLVLNPAESGGTRFLLLSIAFESNNAALIEDMKARDAELRDTVLLTLGAKTVDQLADVRVREQIKAELGAAAVKLFKKRGITRVYFPQFVIQ